MPCLTLYAVSSRIVRVRQERQLVAKQEAMMHGMTCYTTCLAWLVYFQNLLTEEYSVLVVFVAFAVQ